MSWRDLPREATWRHLDARDGSEVLFHEDAARGHRLRGHTTAVESGVAWSVGYDISTDEAWRTQRVRATSLTATGEVTVELECRGGRWTVDGVPRPDLDGCIDIDLESSSVTNLLPIRRLDLPVGETVSVPAAFIRPDDLRVERLEQTYTRLDDAGRFAYTSSTFDFACELVYDESGLVTSYPGIAVRVS